MAQTSGIFPALSDNVKKSGPKPKRRPKPQKRGPAFNCY